MQVRWSPDAVADLQHIIDYIRADNPVAAERVGRTIYDRLNTLGGFPYGGRKGRVQGTRELALTPLPFLVVYRILEQENIVQIVNLIHGAQRWPPAD